MSTQSNRVSVSVRRKAIDCAYLMIFLLGLLFGPLAYAATAAPEVQLTMTASVTTVAAGTQFTYTIQYQCASITTACAAATVTDVLPAALSGNSADVSLVGSAQTTATSYTSSTRTAQWTFVNPLPAGSTGQVQLNVKFPTGTTANGATAVNSASMSATGATTATSNPVTVTATATNAWTLAKTRISGGTGAALDQDVIYQIQACPNTSNVNLANTIVTDTLPTGATFVSASNGGSYANGTVTWNIGAPTATAGCNTVYLDIQYPSGAFSIGSTVTNTATLTATIPVTSGSGSITPLTSSVSHSLSAAVPNKTVTKKISSSSANIGQSVTYDFDTTNTGNVALSTFSIVDNIPPQLNVTQINSGYSVYNITPNLAIEYQTNTNLNWTPVTGFPRTLGSSSTNVTVSSLNLGTGVYITALRYTYLSLPVGFKATGSSSGPGFAATLLATDRAGNTVSPGNVISNTGSYSYSYNGTPSNGTSTATLTVTQPTTQTTDPNAVPKLDKVVSGTSTVLPGGTVTYQLTLNNASNAGSALINPVLGDLLDPGLSYVANSATVSTRPTGMPNPTVETLANYNNTGRTLLRFHWDGASAYSLPANTSAVLKFNVTVNIGTLPGSIANVADLLSYGNSTITTSNCYTPMPADTYDLNANGNKTETLCASKSSGANITVGVTAAMQSVMMVKGQLDANNLQYPSNGTTVVGGSLLYTLQVSNVGNVPMTNTQVIDILPFVGDTGVLDPQSRLSAWRPNLIAPVVAPAGVTVYYSTQSNPCRTELGYSPTGCTPANWSTSPPADITTVQALKFNFGSIVVNPLDMLQLSWPMRAPLGAPTSGAIAWNSFGYVATRADNSVALLATEPNKVGVAIQPPTPPIYNGYVWLDSNGNGIQDSNEPGMNDVRVDLYQSNGVQVDSTITTSNGSGNPGYYQFSNLTPGNFYALFYPPVGYAVTQENAGANLALNSEVNPATNTTAITALTWGQTYSYGNMGLRVSSTASVGNYVWFDQNGNGLQDEPTNDGLNGITVRAYSTSNPGTPVATAVTANDVNNNPGFYQITGLPPGTYYLAFAKPTGATFTVADTGSNDQVDSDANPSTGQTATFSLVAGQYDASWDAGIILPTGTASLGEWVWLDTNNNGIYEPFGGELGINNVRVNLYEDTDGNGGFTPGIDQYYTTTTTYTSGGYPGYYSFTGLPAGAYVVQIDPMNFVTGQPLAGLIASTSIFNPNSGVLNENTGYLLTGYGAVSKAVTLSIGSVLTDNFGFTATYSLGNRVFRDDGTGGGTANDGVQNGAEPGIAGVAVDVYLSAGGAPTGTPVAPVQTTNASGYYRFDGLPAGSYVVVVNQTGSSALNGLVSSTGYSSNFAIGGDLSDHGIDTPLGQTSVLPGGIASLPVILSVGGEPLGESLGLTAAGLDGPNGDASDNLVVDFGFTPSYSLGNRVFRDDGTGGGIMNNGKQDGGEPGIAGVSVKLFQSDAGGNPTDGVLATQVTDASGYYRFDGLPAGQYVAVVDQANSPALSQMFSSTGNSTNFALAGDLADHGIDTPLGNTSVLPGGIAAAAVSLGAGGEPTGEALGSAGAGLNGPNGDASDTLAADFGFVPSFSLGNRIWIDNGAGGGTANDGILNGSEPAAPAGVGLQLLDSSGANVVATTATDGSGYYRFDGLTAGTYTVRVADANFASGGALSGYKPSAGYFADVSGVASNNRNHGQSQGGHVLSPAVTLGSAEPNGDADGAQPTAAAKNGPNGDAYDNLLVDFGFTPTYSLGDRIFKDDGSGGGVVNDGIQNGGEPGIAGVAVDVYLSAGGAPTGTPVAPAQTTDASGYYRFDGLPAGSYVVVVDKNNSPALSGMVSSTGDSSSFALSGDLTDHGIDTPLPNTSALPGGIATLPVTLGLATEPLGEAVGTTAAGQNGPNGDGSDNLVVYFGFTPTYSLGNRVFRDDGTGGGTLNNGKQDGGEPGIAGVAVKLFQSDASGNLTGSALGTQVTDASGYYRFDGLVAGNYVVIVDQPGSPALSQMFNSTGNSTNFALAGDLADHGIDTPLGNTSVLPGGIMTAMLSLGAGQEPTGEALGSAGAGLNGPNGDAADTLVADFGFVPSFSLGNRVWIDNGAGGGTANDGILNGSEPAVPAGVSLQLLDSSGANVVATTATDGSGYYRFDGLKAGTYTVRVADANFASGGALSGYKPSAGYFADVSGVASNNRNHGQSQGGHVLSPAVTLGSTEPSGDVDGAQPTAAAKNGPNGDAYDNLLVDFGFTPTYSLGNRVFRDDGTGGGTLNNGKQDGGEPGIAGVSVKLFQSNASGSPTGGVLATQATDASGYYRFDGLPAGQYVAVVDQANSPALGQMFNSTGNSTNFALAGDLADHGIDTPLGNTSVLPGGIATAAVSLGAGSEPTGEALGSAGAGLNGPNGDTSDTLVADFGFVPSFSLGNRVWIDNGAGNGTANDGILNGGEPTAPAGVSLQLLDSSGANVVATTATDGSGYYRFDGLTAGTYSVRVADANFASGGALSGYKPSAGYFADVSGVTGNNRNHGQSQGGHVLSPAVTLGATEPTGDADAAQPTAAAKNGPNGDAYDNLLVDFGFTPVYSLGNRLWIDNGAGGGVANDGILNGTEPAVQAGVTVELLDGTTTKVIATTTTDTSGYYRFDQLVGGSYVVRVADANFIVGGGLLGYLPSVGYFTDVSSSGQTANNRNHGHSTNGHVTSPVLTLGLSNPAGEVDAVQPTPAAQNGPTSDTGDNLLVDFGFTPGYSLGDYVWFDTNQDGIQQPDERGVAGVTVNLYAADGVTLLQTTQTDGSGNYLFEGLAGGNYVIGFVNPTGYQFTAPNQGTGSLQDSFDSDANVNTGKTAVVSLSGAMSPTNDAGLYFSNGAKPASITDWVWYDTNRDGLQSTGENGLAGVTVNLWDGGHTKILASTVSDGQGGYEFTGLAAGTYTVQFVAPSGYAFTVYETGNGSHSGSDSDAAVATGLTAPITLAAGQNFSAADAGLYLTGTNTGTNGAIIGNKVWYDTNDNGIQDAGEPGIPGVTVFLYAADGVTWLAETKTDATGTYGFSGLAAGTYDLEFFAYNSLYTFSPQAKGSSIALDSDADASNGWVGGVTVSAGQTRTDLDVGMVIINTLPFSAGNSVWLDGNHNLQFDSGEGLANAQVVLYNGWGDELARLTTTAANANYLYTGLGQGSYRVEINKTSLPANASEIADPDAVLDSTTDVLNLASNLTTVNFGYSTLIDFGDLPDTYASLLASNGPRHGIGGIYLGTGVTDAESDGQPTADASGDNLNGSTPNDEQGVSMADLWVGGQNAVIKVTASAAGVLNAWADWNNNGTFEANENFLNDQALTAGVNSLTVAVPVNAVAGQVALRYRATNATGQGGESPTGLAGNGEVEDYLTTLYAPNMVGSIAGEVRNDTNGDGNLAAGYAGLAGATVALYTDPNGDGNPSDGTLQASVVTDATGQYNFGKLLPGNYVAVETNPIAIPVFVSTNDAVGANNDLIPVVLASGNLTVTGRDFLDHQVQPASTAGTTGGGTGGASGSGSSTTGGSNGPVASIPLGDGVTQCAGAINLLKNATPQQLEGLRQDNGGDLVFGFTFNEANKGSENAQSEGLALNDTLMSLMLSFSDGTQQSYSIANGSCQTQTYSVLATAGGGTRNPTYTLIGSEHTDRWGAGALNDVQNTVDSTLQCTVPASLGKVTGATLNVSFLRTDVTRGDPEAFYDCTGPAQLTLLDAADTQFVNHYAAGQAQAPAMALTNPAPTPDPMAVASWNSFPSSSTYYVAAYEDQYTVTTDYDFNDAVVAYQVKFGLNYNNQVVQIVGNAYLLARGAAYSHDWHLRIGLPATVKTTVNCTTTLNTSPQTSFGCNANDANPPAYPIMSAGTVDVVGFGNTLSIFPNTEHPSTSYMHTFTNTLYGDTYLQGPRSSFTINLSQPTDPATIAAAPFDPYLYVWNTKQSVQLYQVNPAITDAKGNPYGLLLPSGWQWAHEGQDIRAYAYPQLPGFIASQGTSSVTWYNSPKTNYVFPLPAGWAW